MQCRDARTTKAHSPPRHFHQYSLLILCRHAQIRARGCNSILPCRLVGYQRFTSQRPRAESPGHHTGVVSWIRVCYLQTRCMFAAHTCSVHVSLASTADLGPPAWSGTGAWAQSRDGQLRLAVLDRASNASVPSPLAQSPLLFSSLSG